MPRQPCCGVARRFCLASARPLHFEDVELSRKISLAQKVEDPCQPKPRAPSLGCVCFGLLQVRQVLQHRIGCHKLPIVAGQHQRPSVSRASYLCMQCNMSALGYKSNVLSECPATQAARAPYARTCFRRAAPCCSSCVTQALSAIAKCILACLTVYNRRLLKSSEPWPAAVVVGRHAQVILYFHLFHSFIPAVFATVPPPANHLTTSCVQCRN